MFHEIAGGFQSCVQFSLPLTPFPQVKAGLLYLEDFIMLMRQDVLYIVISTYLSWIQL